MSFKFNVRLPKPPRAASVSSSGSVSTEQPAEPSESESREPSPGTAAEVGHLESSGTAKVVPSSPAPQSSPDRSDLAVQLLEMQKQQLVEQQQLLHLMEDLDGQIRQNAARQEQKIGEWQRSAIELATAMTARILHEKIEANTFPFEKIITEITAEFQASHDQILKIRMNPLDLEGLQSRLGQRFDQYSFTSLLLADAQLHRGQCRVESSLGFIESNVVDRLNLLRSQLLGSLKNA